MLVFKGSPLLHKIVVLNSKGGSGKTTMAFNLAGYLAATGRKTAIIDMDRQGSSMRWLRNRSSALPEIVGIPLEVSYTDAASRLISALLLKAQVSRRNQRLCVVPNRVKERTIAYQQLCRFLDRLSITVVGLVRDSQNYVWAARNGTCIHEMPLFRVSKDVEHWEAISEWLEKRLATPLNSRDFLRPEETVQERQRKRLRSAPFVPLAAAVGMIAISLGLFVSAGESPVTANRFQFPWSNSEPANQNLIAEIAAPQPGRSVADGLERRWQLNGTVNWGDSGLLIVRDRTTNDSLVVRNNHDLNGWEVSEIGTDHAVFSQGEEEVRLDVGYE